MRFRLRSDRAVRAGGADPLRRLCATSGDGNVALARHFGAVCNVGNQFLSRPLAPPVISKSTS